MDAASWSPIAVALGAVPGALSRYYLTLFGTTRFGKKFPYGTFFINLTGSFLIGVVSAWLTQQSVPFPHLRELLIVGFLGAYTTFSTYALDTSTLIQTRRLKTALFYWIGSPLLGLAGVELGLAIGQLL